jgi:hypothetical protein
MKKFVTTYILGFDVVPRASGVAVFKLLDNIFSLDWKAKFKQMMEEEAKKRLGAAAGLAGGLMAKAQQSLPQPSDEEKAAEEERKAKVEAEIAEGNPPSHCINTIWHWSLRAFFHHINHPFARG